MVFRIFRIFILFVLLAVFCPAVLYADMKVYTREWTYQAVGIDTLESSRRIAFERVRQLLLDDAATYLEGHTEVRFFSLSRADVRALLAGIVRVDQMKEDWTGRTFLIKAGVQFDAAEVVKALDSLRKDKPRADRFVKNRKKSGEIFAKMEASRKELAAAKTGQEPASRYQQAIRDLEAADLVLAGIQSDIAGDEGKAVKAFTRAAELSPEDKEIYAERALAYQRMGKDDKAIEDLSIMIRLSPADASPYVQRGTLYSKLGRMEEAVADFDRAIAARPADVEAHYRRGLMHQQAGRFAEAVREYQRVLEVDPAHAEAKKNLNLCFEKVGTRELGIEYFDAVIAQHPGYLLAYTGRGIAHWKLGHDSEALEDFRHVIELKPDDATTRRLLFLIRGRSGDYEGAIAEYFGIYEKDLAGIMAYNEPEKAYGGAIHFEQVSKDFQAAFRMHPKNVAQYVYRGIVRMEACDYDRAASDFSAASRLDPKDARPVLLRGVSIGRIGNFTLAVRFCSLAIEVEPDSAVLYAVRGMAYEALGDKPKSLQDLKKAAKLGHRGARERLRARGY